MGGAVPSMFVHRREHDSGALRQQSLAGRHGASPSARRVDVAVGDAVEAPVRERRFQAPTLAWARDVTTRAGNRLPRLLILPRTPWPRTFREDVARGQALTSARTPRFESPREYSPYLRPGMQSTPVSAEQKHVFRFFCPLCMSYFQGIYETECCRNQMCHKCLVQYVRSQFPVADGPERIPENLPSNLPCCHCTKQSLKVSARAPDAAPRSYEDEAESPELQGAAVSPVKIGDSFEELKRKMIHFSPDVPEAKKEGMALCFSSPASGSGSATITSVSTPPAPLQVALDVVDSLITEAVGELSRRSGSVVD